MGDESWLTSGGLLDLDSGSPGSMGFTASPLADITASRMNQTARTVALSHAAPLDAVKTRGSEGPFPFAPSPMVGKHKHAARSKLRAREWSPPGKEETKTETKAAPAKAVTSATAELEPPAPSATQTTRAQASVTSGVLPEIPPPAVAAEPSPVEASPSTTLGKHESSSPEAEERKRQRSASPERAVSASATGPVAVGCVPASRRSMAALVAPGAVSRGGRRLSLGLDAFDSSAPGLEGDAGLGSDGGGLLEDITEDFTFVAAATPKGKVIGSEALARSPVAEAADDEVEAGRAEAAEPERTVAEEKEKEQGREEEEEEEEEETFSEVGEEDETVVVEVNSDDETVEVEDEAALAMALGSDVPREEDTSEQRLEEESVRAALGAEGVPKEEDAMVQLTVADTPAAEALAASTATTDPEFERRILSAMNAAERGGGLAAARSGNRGVVNSPPAGGGLKPFETPMPGHVAKEEEGEEAAPMDVDSADAMNEPPTPYETPALGVPETPLTAPTGATQYETPALVLDTDPKSVKGSFGGVSTGGKSVAGSSGFESEVKSRPLAPVMEEGEKDVDSPPRTSPLRTPGKPPRSAKKKDALVDASTAMRNDKEDAVIATPPKAQGDGDEPPKADFEAMLAKAMAAVEHGSDMTSLFRGGESSKVMNSPAAPKMGRGRVMNSPAATGKPPKSPAVRRATRACRAAGAKASVAGEPEPAPAARSRKAAPRPAWKSAEEDVAPDTSAEAAGASDRELVGGDASPPVGVPGGGPRADDDFEARLAAALAAAEAGGGLAAAFGGGGSRVANSPVGNKSRWQEEDVRTEARRQGVTKSQLMHARMHADASPLR